MGIFYSKLFHNKKSLGSIPTLYGEPHLLKCALPRY
nr:MAG TPA: hypothetical protein [Caudoviricetes sp.]